MRSVSFTTTVRIRNPQSNVVDFDAYRRGFSQVSALVPADEEPAAPPSQIPAPKGDLHRFLQDTALVLEICVGFSMIVLIFVTLFRVLL